MGKGVLVSMTYLGKEVLVSKAWFKEEKEEPQQQERIKLRRNVPSEAFLFEDCKVLFSKLPKCLWLGCGSMNRLLAWRGFDPQNLIN